MMRRLTPLCLRVAPKLLMRRARAYSTSSEGSKFDALVSQAVEVIKSTLPELRKPIPDTKVLVGMSGGVDSSVTALLLKATGFQVVGAFMDCWDAKDETGVCQADKDYKDAQVVSGLLGIPLSRVNFVKQYWNHVFEDFLNGYRAGVTPNPDVLCNREIKFKAFAQYASTVGADLIATGHYAQLDHLGQDVRLKMSLFSEQDQSYFLSMVPGSQFRNVVFPVGHLSKPQVRMLAYMAKLGVAEKKHSTGICFIGDRKLSSFLAEYIPMNPGVFKDVDGGELGSHKGMNEFTIGQGARIPGATDRYFVCGVEPETGTVFVCKGPMHPALFSDQCQVSGFNWIAGHPPPQILRGEAMEFTHKVRNRTDSGRSTLTLSSANPTTFDVNFLAPQRAVALGQVLVLYDDAGVCLGGGLIHKIGPSYKHMRKELPSLVYR